MRFARSIELTAWTIGGVLIVLHASARLTFEHERVAGIEAFTEAYAEASELHVAGQSLPAVAGQAMPSAVHVDQSLWSRQRVSAFAASAAKGPPPKAVLTIPALQLQVPVYPGASEINLNRGAAHVEGTAAFADSGNIGIAAHRDGFFRKLKDIAIDDEIGLDVGTRKLRYRVVDISIVSPSDVHVLAPTETPTVTLVTCYPFYFVGTAPQRYIVRAERTAARPGEDAVAEVLHADDRLL